MNACEEESRRLCTGRAVPRRQIVTSDNVLRQSAYSCGSVVPFHGCAPGCDLAHKPCLKRCPPTKTRHHPKWPSKRRDALRQRLEERDKARAALVEVVQEEDQRIAQLPRCRSAPKIGK